MYSNTCLRPEQRLEEVGITHDCHIEVAHLFNQFESNEKHEAFSMKIDDSNMNVSNVIHEQSFKHHEK